MDMLAANAPISLHIVLSIATPSIPALSVALVFL
jgi:hypothetical protein